MSGPSDDFMKKVLEALWPDWDPFAQPQGVPHTDAYVPVGASAASQNAASDLAFHMLSNLIEWHMNGHLSEAEFKIAKQKLGLVCFVFFGLTADAQGQFWGRVHM